MSTVDVAQLKQIARATWATGDYTEVAKRDLWDVGPRIVQRIGIGGGDEVLDVGCGTGNAALRAAETGARVVGLDLTPELLDEGRSLAREGGVEVEWVEGDAENLPFPDQSFDAVISTFGCMFAPRHAVAAREMARVLRPAGRLAICAWTPDGAIGEFFRTLSSHLPPPPDFAAPPPLWGSEDHVRGLFAGTGVELEFERGEVIFEFESVDEAVGFYETKFGPVMKAREQLEPQGRWPALRDDLHATFTRLNVSDGDDFVERAEYLLTLGRKSG